MSHRWEPRVREKMEAMLIRLGRIAVVVATILHATSALA